MPFRASKLTQLLRGAFIEPGHRTALVACAAPDAADVWHTVNTLRHVALMAPPLAAMTRSIEVEVRRHDGEAGSLGPVSTWTHDDALRWIASAEGGRFAHVVLPRGASGRTLLLLSAQRLSSLFAAEEAGARGEGEGPQWTISAAGEDHSATTKLGRALFTALRRHDCLR